MKLIVLVQLSPGYLELASGKFSDASLVHLFSGALGTR